MKPQSKTPLQRRLEAFIKEHNGVQAAAAALGVNRTYLWKLRHGRHTTPSDKLLEKLGFKRVEKLVSI
jgi:hypothetical protein